jgi:hypothetical protein
MNLTLILGEDEKHMLPQIRDIIAKQRLPEITIQIEGEGGSHKEAARASDEEDRHDAQ